MLNLLKKEFIVSFNKQAIKNLIIILLIIGVSTIVMPIFLLLIPIVLPTLLSYVIIFNNFNYEDLNKSELFINSLPNKREDIVYAKYIFSLIISVAVLVLSTLILKDIKILHVNIVNYRTVALVLSALFLSNSINFIIIFKWKYKKVKNIVWITVIPIFLIIESLFKIIDDKINHINIYGSFPEQFASGEGLIYDSIVNYINLDYINYSTMILFSVIVLILSLFISIKIYRNKDLV